MSIVKTLRFPARALWTDGRLVELSAPDKRRLPLATPPEFKGGIPGIWSPEELLVGAVAACYELTLAAVAERLGVALERVTVDAAGHVDRGKAGYAFSVLELDVEVEVDPAHEEGARRAARLAEEHCIVARALDVPVHVSLSIVRAPALEAAAS